MIFWILGEINLEKDLPFSTSSAIHPGINPQTNRSEGVTALLDEGNTLRISPKPTDVLQKNPSKHELNMSELNKMLAHKVKLSMYT